MLFTACYVVVVVVVTRYFIILVCFMFDGILFAIITNVVFIFII